MPYEEEDTDICAVNEKDAEEEDTCMPYEEEDTDICAVNEKDAEEEDTCMPMRKKIQTYVQ
jgi:hypothetical protein